MIDIVAALRQLSETGSRSDQRLSQLVLADMTFASHAAIAELAEKAGVSEPTVTRFCRSLGCDGIRDFKFHLAQALAIGGTYLNGAPEDDTRPNLDRVCDGAVRAIDRMRAELDRAQFAVAAKRLAKASSVLAFGSGGSSTVAALETQHRLFRLGLPVAAYTDGELQRMTASVANRSTVVVAYSISGHVQSVIDAVRIAREYGAFTIVVTAKGSQLARHGDVTITFKIPEDPDLYRPSSSRFALLIAVDLLAMETAQALGPAVFERLRRIKQSLNTLKINDPSLPIGD
jgi:DNA-binding MurR/RpiR family transcriptional regulator